jgi:Uri superfamily endonuclease
MTEADYYDVVIAEDGKVKEFRSRHISNPPKNELEQWHYDYYQEQIARINAAPAKWDRERLLATNLFASMTETPNLIDAGSILKPMSPVPRLF